MTAGLSSSEQGSNHAATFKEKLAQRWRKSLFLCVGLDSAYSQIPPFLQAQPPDEALFLFNVAIIDATAEYCCAFKPNLAFYEQSGPPGLLALKYTCDYIHERYPDIPVILDAKRGDIGSTNQAYADALYDYYGGDAVTVQPYLGRAALLPFLERRERGVLVLCRTSNPGVEEIQDLKILPDEEVSLGPAVMPLTDPLYLKVARLVAENWNDNNNVGLVTGATYPEELGEVRAVAPDLPLLIPGIGAQGGDLAAVIRNGIDKNGGGIIISSSRSIIFASKERNYGEAAGRAAAAVANEIKQIIG